MKPRVHMRDGEYVTACCQPLSLWEKAPHLLTNILAEVTCKPCRKWIEYRDSLTTPNRKKRFTPFGREFNDRITRLTPADVRLLNNLKKSPS